MDNEETIVKYVTRTSPTFTIHLLNESFQAVHGVLSLPKSYADVLDKMVASGKRPDITQAVQKIDEEAAIALVRAHQASLKPAAQRGVVTHSGSPLREAQQTNLDALRNNHKEGQETLPANHELSPSAIIPPTLQGDIARSLEAREAGEGGRETHDTAKVAGDVPLKKIDGGAVADHTQDPLKPAPGLTTAPVPEQAKPNPLSALLHQQKN